jgi:hypothetical protein
MRHEQASTEFFLIAATHMRTTSRDLAGGLGSLRLLETLEDYRTHLQISERPAGTVNVIPGTEGKGRILGSPIPIYTETQLKTEPITEKTLYNLFALAGFQPPKNKR